MRGIGGCIPEKGETELPATRHAGTGLASALLMLLAGCQANDDRPAAASSLSAAAADKTGTFAFENWAGPLLRVWYWAPSKVVADTPIVFVLHGVKRDADRYLAEWKPIAQHHGFIVVVPEFSNVSFPGSRGYNTGYFVEADGSPRPRAQWSFAALEPLFDAIKARTGSEVPRYALYGHSAGAQFVHRYVLFMPEARLSHAVAANAGWYTLPALDTAYPYGLAGTPVAESDLKRALGKPLTILLGTADTDRADPNFRTTKEADAQGAHRFARGQGFHAAGRAAAARLAVPFGWRLQEVPGVGHDNAAMAVAAAPLLTR